VKARNSRPLAKSGESALLPDLHEVEVYLLASTQKARTWSIGRGCFCTTYFKPASADLNSYSLLGEPPDLAPEIGVA
jgi:hypothetical protein